MIILNINFFIIIYYYLIRKIKNRIMQKKSKTCLSHFLINKRVFMKNIFLSILEYANATIYSQLLNE